MFDCSLKFPIKLDVNVNLNCQIEKMTEYFRKLVERFKPQIPSSVNIKKNLIISEQN